MVGPNKKIDILEAAYLEFASKGYEDASTNNITKAAGISKGLLFYHYGNKLNLYRVLVSNLLDKLECFVRMIDADEPDLLKRYLKMATFKTTYFKDDQSLFLFMGSLIRNDLSLLDQDLYERYVKVGQIMQRKKKSTDHIDTSLFIDTLDVDSLIEIIGHTIRGYEEMLKEKYQNASFEIKDIDQSMKAFEEYVNKLRKIFYK